MFIFWQVFSVSFCVIFWCLDAQLIKKAVLMYTLTPGNHANEIVELINQNRTVTKLPKLSNSPGLGCMALQFLMQCTKNCSSNNTLNCHPPQVDITEVYAPNCGVELPTVDTISGRLLGCHWENLSPEHAFSDALAPNKKSLALLHRKEHTEVGVGYVREHHGPFLWCALFSSGNTSSSFVLEGGKGIEQRSGCFSGVNVQCNAGCKVVLPLNSLLLYMCHLVLQLVVLLVWWVGREKQRLQKPKRELDFAQ